MDLHLYPDPVLRAGTEPVTAFDPSLGDLAQDMIRTMHERTGLGLAAPQVGLSTRLAVVSSDEKPGHEIVLINPELVWTDGWEEREEGCLSVPGVYVKIGRFGRVRVRFQDLQGQIQEMEAEGLFARAIQHEVDHLNGRLILDRMSPVQQMAQRRQLHELQTRYRRRTKRTETGTP